MILASDTIYIAQKDNGKFIICVQVPHSRNYLHGDIYDDLKEAILEMRMLQGAEITSEMLDIQEDGSYWRLVVYLYGQQYHSRKLNLEDIVLEFQQMTL